MFTFTRFEVLLANLSGCWPFPSLRCGCGESWWLFFIILDWIFVSMNTIAMRFPAGMSHVKLINFRSFFSGKNVSVVAICLLTNVQLLWCFYICSSSLTYELQWKYSGELRLGSLYIQGGCLKWEKWKLSLRWQFKVNCQQKPCKIQLEHITCVSRD